MVLGWRRKRKSSVTITKPKVTNNNTEIPSHFLCPISLDLMRDPVTLSSGITYDRESIDTWLESGNFTCPVTNQILRSFDAVPNHSLRKMIQDWCAKNRLQRIPTPLVPVGPDEVSRTLLALEASALRLDGPGCIDLLGRIQRWCSESERNRRCIAVNGAVNALAKSFDFFARADDNNNNSIFSEILSTLSWMSPIKDDDFVLFMGSERSLHCMVRFLSNNNVSLTVKRNSAAVLEELIIQGQETVTKNLAKVEGVSETLMGLVRSRICPEITKSSLLLIQSLISSDNNKDGNKTMRSKFLEMGLVSSVLELLVEAEKVAIIERGLGVLEAVCEHEDGRRSCYENCLTMPVLVKKLLRVSNLATEFSVSAIWKLLCDDNIRHKNQTEDHLDVTMSNAIVEALQVGAFQKLLVIIQVGCGYETKEKVTELLKLLNPFRLEFECIESLDFKSLKRSF